MTNVVSVLYICLIGNQHGIVNAPSREDDPQYIVKLIGKVITVSLEIVEIVEGLPELGFLRKNPLNMNLTSSSLHERPRNFYTRRTR